MLMKTTEGVQLTSTCALFVSAPNQLDLRIRPEMLARWHRAGFRRCWGWKSIDTSKLDRFQPTDSAGREALPASFLGALGQ
jgi:hypothetical protein